MIVDENIVNCDKYDIKNNRIYEGDKGYLYEFKPIIKENIHLPFLLYVPINNEGKKDLFVVGKTPHVSFDTFDQALEAAKYDKREDRVYLSLGSYIHLLSSKYNNPVLIPIIPRCPGLDTYYLGYRMHHNDFTIPLNLYKIGFSKFNESDLESFKNLDKQLVNMIDYALNVLNNNGYDVNEKVIMCGYSSTSKLANFFSWLHPSKVKMIIAGGTGGLMMLPIKNYNGYDFNYPIGINDIEVNIDEFKKIKQLYFIAENDINDPVRPKVLYLKDDNNKYIKDSDGKKIEMVDNDGNVIYDLDENNNYKYQDDNGSYTDYQVNAIIRSFGFDIVKRFDMNEKIYKENGIECCCKKYKGDHFSIWKDINLNKDIEKFYIKNK